METRHLLRQRAAKQKMRANDMERRACGKGTDGCNGEN